MTESRGASTHASTGWGSSRSEGALEERTRLRDVLPPIAAALLIAIANLAYGAVQPAASLPLSAMAVCIAIAAIAVAGQRAVTLGMLAGAVVLTLVAATGIAGPLHRAGPQLATLFAAGAMWIIGYLAARRGRTLDFLWTAIIWSAIAWCVWVFFAYVSTTRGGFAPKLVDAFETPANGALVFGLLAIVGMGRTLHLLKQSDAEALAPPQILDRVLREGVGGLLLLTVSLTCLVLLGSRPGIMFVGGVLLGYAWWDTLSITRRARFGLTVRLLVIAAPFVAIALAGWGVVTGWLVDETVPAGLGSSEFPPNIQRMEAYMASWLESPVLGHGLGSLPAESARFQTLDNAKAMLAPGGAHNVFLSWTVETGLIGLALLVWTTLVTHLRIGQALASRRTTRSVPRMAVAAGALMLLHGVTDSSLNVPAVAWLYALLVGAACGLAPSARRATAEQD